MKDFKDLFVWIKFENHTKDLAYVDLEDKNFLEEIGTDYDEMQKIIKGITFCILNDYNSNIMSFNTEKAFELFRNIMIKKCNHSENLWLYSSFNKDWGIKCFEIDSINNSNNKITFNLLLDKDEIKFAPLKTPKYEVKLDLDKLLEKGEEKMIETKKDIFLNIFLIGQVLSYEYPYITMNAVLYEPTTAEELNHKKVKVSETCGEKFFNKFFEKADTISAYGVKKDSEIIIYYATIEDEKEELEKERIK